MIVNPHRIETENFGDIASSPLKFFDFKETSTMEVEITNMKEEDLLDNHIIVGGGGLLDNMYFFSNIVKLCELKQSGKIKSLTFWGVGTNAHFDEKDCMSLYNNSKSEKIISVADLKGIRDRSTTYEYVPCVTCMDPSFDKYAGNQPKHKEIYYEHHHRKLPIFEDFHEYEIPIMRNDQPKTIREAVDFLSSGETVFTNTFHGAYWALLLGRKVVCKPFSTKFDSLDTSVERQSPSLDYLDECRQKNIKFYERTIEKYDT